MANLIHFSFFRKIEKAVLAWYHEENILNFEVET